MPPFVVAIAQRAPVYGDGAATLDRLDAIAKEATSEGATLVVFGETWLGGYPAWLDRAPGAALWEHEPSKEAYLELVRTSIAVPGPETERMGALCARHGIAMVIGVHERPRRGPGQGTLFNTLLVFDQRGELAVHHRKLVPTYNERLVWGPGDGHGLVTAEMPFGRLGGLICWEHWMPLARQAMHDAGETVHVALWPSVNESHQLSSRHYAFEGRCFVLAAGSIMRRADLPRAFAEPGDGDELILRGGSAVIGPDGNYVIEPVFDEERLLVAELDPERVETERMTLDVSGHYARPDVFELTVERRRLLREPK